MARLFERKGHDDLLAIAPEVLKANPKVRFVWIGSGIWRERLEAEADRLGVRHAIHFTGLVPPDRIPELLSAVDAVVHPSYREGLARVLPQVAHRGPSGDQLRRRWSARSLHHRRDRRTSPISGPG